VRKRLWQLHSWLGLIAGLGLLVIGLTGSLLVFNQELTALFEPGRVVVAPAASGRLPLDTLLHAAERQLPDHEITGWILQNARPDRADHLYAIRHGTNEWLVATLDPYTGRVLDAPRPFTAFLHGWLVELHYTFFAGDFGVAFAGVLAALLCLLGLSGLWLYRGFWKNVLTLRWGRGARILFSDLHKFVGISSVAFNLVLGFTGAYWNITHTLAHVGGHEPEQAVLAGRLYAGTLSLDALVRDAAARLPGFRTNFISLPSDPTAPAVTLWGVVEPRPFLRGEYGSTVVYDPATGAHRGTADLRTAGAWPRTTDTFTALHYGTFGGLAVKILWALGGLTPGVLGVSGFTIWWLRRSARRAASPGLAAIAPSDPRSASPSP